MRKLLLVILLIGAVAASFFWFRPRPKSTASPNLASPNPTETANTNTHAGHPVAAVPAKVSRPPEKPNFGPHSDFLDSDIISAVRKAVAAGDREALDAAYVALVEFIKAHPEKLDDYIASLKSEENEHVLRALSRALGDSEAVWGEKLTQVAIELAKDTSFQQRQHMMLHLMGQFPEIQDDVYKTVLQLSEQDPDSQVKTSAVVVLADMMEKFPEQAMAFLADVMKVFNTATEEDVLAFTYQLLAHHKEKLTPEMHAALLERLKTQLDPFMRIPIISALSVAPEDIRKQAVDYLNALFAAEQNLDNKRNQLAQLVAVQRGEAVPMLRKLANGGDVLAQDAKDYLSLIELGPLDPEMVFNLKATRDVMSKPVEKDEH